MEQKGEMSLFMEATNYGLLKRDSGEWTQLDYLKHMHEVAILVQLPINQILEYEKEIKDEEKKETYYTKEKEVDSESNI